MREYDNEDEDVSGHFFAPTFLDVKKLSLEIVSEFLRNDNSKDINTFIQYAERVEKYILDAPVDKPIN